jgi:hypothetical protein
MHKWNETVFSGGGKKLCNRHRMNYLKIKRENEMG